VVVEVVFYELWKHAGAAGLIVFSAIITTAGFMLLYLRCLLGGAEKHWAAAATAFGALASAPSWGAAADVHLTLASLLSMLSKPPINSKRHKNKESSADFCFGYHRCFSYGLNLHAGFALGLALLFAYGLGLIMETAAGNTPLAAGTPIIVRCCCFWWLLALVPLSPSGAQLYRYPVRYFALIWNAVIHCGVVLTRFSMTGSIVHFYWYGCCF